MSGRIDPGQVWRHGERHLRISAVSYEPPYVVVHDAQPDEGRPGQWVSVDGTRQEVSEVWLRAECVHVPMAGQVGGARRRRELTALRVGYYRGRAH